MDVGILSLQGDVAEHSAALIDIGVAPRRVRRPEDLVGLDGIILPGGESTTMTLGIEREGLAVGFHPSLVFLLCEIRRPQIAVGHRRTGRILERLLVEAFRLFVVVLAVVDSGQIVERVRIIGIDGQRHLVILAGLIEREHVMIGDPDFIRDHSGSRRIALVGVNGCCIAATNHEPIAFGFG